jgi:AdoMet-dependent heme synthase
MKQENLNGAFLSLTNKCNLCCKYCYQGSSPYTNITKELKKEEWGKIIIQLKKLKAKKINFVGGEPFLYKDFWHVLHFAYKKGFKIKVFTNGTLLGKEELIKLKKCHVTISFNLNSEDRKIQEFFQGRGNWKKTVNAIKQCKKQGLEFEIASPIIKDNLRSINQFIDFCKKLGAKRIRLVPLVLSGNAVNLKKYKPSKNKIQELSSKIENKGIEITIGCRNCEAGTHYITIQANGDVTPCSINRNVIMGNIKKDTLKSLLKTARKSKQKFRNICLK